jgi:hypothetical protein
LIGLVDPSTNIAAETVTLPLFATKVLGLYTNTLLRYPGAGFEQPEMIHTAMRPTAVIFKNFMLVKF